MATLLKNFTAQKVIGKASEESVQSFCHRHNCAVEEKDFKKLKKREKIARYKEIIFQAITAHTNASLMLHQLEMVYVLSKKEALFHLIERIQHASKVRYLLEEIKEKQLERECDKVFHFLEKEPLFIEDFYYLYVLHSHSASDWNRRHTDIISRSASITQMEIASLEALLQDELPKIAHGKRCQIRYLEENGKEHLLIMAEDLPTTSSQWEKEGMAYVLRKPVLEIGIVYDRTAGELHTCSSGGVKLRRKMECLFSEAVLGRKIPEVSEEEAYDLSCILQQLTQEGRVSFRPDASKNVKDIFIKEVKLSPKNSSKSPVTVKTPDNKRGSQIKDDIFFSLKDYLKMDEASPANTVLIHDLQLARVECIAVWIDEITGKERKRKFAISPSRCSLGFENTDAEIRQCLIAAKIQIPANKNALTHAA